MALRLMDAAKLHVLHIIPPLGNPFEFYELERGLNPEYWDVIGIEQKRGSPAMCELRLMHIEIEMLDEVDYDGEPVEFDTFNEALSGVTMTPDELTELIHLLERWTGDPLPSPNDTISMFRAMERRELDHLHVRPSNPKAAATWYRYLPDGVDSMDEITLVHPPRWRADSRNDRQQQGWLEVVTVSLQQLDDPSFDPLDAWGLARIVVSQPTLRELVSLLKRHSY